MASVTPEIMSRPSRAGTRTHGSDVPSPALALSSVLQCPHDAWLPYPEYFLSNWNRQQLSPSRQGYSNVRQKMTVFCALKEKPHVHPLTKSKL